MTYSTESRPKGAYVRGAELAALSSTAERTMETVHELAARWHRADESAGVENMIVEAEIIRGNQIDPERLLKKPVLLANRFRARQ